MDTTQLHEAFVRNFIQKDRRERCLLELKRGTFINRLSHNWEEVLDMRYMVVVNKHADTFSFLKQELKLRNETTSFIVSCYPDVHRQELALVEAFKMIYGRGLPSLLIFEEGQKIYVETEQEQGAPVRLIGKTA